MPLSQREILHYVQKGRKNENLNELLTGQRGGGLRREILHFVQDDRVKGMSSGLLPDQSKDEPLPSPDKVAPNSYLVRTSSVPRPYLSLVYIQERGMDEVRTRYDFGRTREGRGRGIGLLQLRFKSVSRPPHVSSLQERGKSEERRRSEGETKVKRR